MLICNCRCRYRVKGSSIFRSSSLNSARLTLSKKHSQQTCSFRQDGANRCLMASVKPAQRSVFYALFIRHEIFLALVLITFDKTVGRRWQCLVLPKLHQWLLKPYLLLLRYQETVHLTWNCAQPDAHCRCDMRPRVKHGSILLDLVHPNPQTYWPNL